jgi:hypothetical protein
MSGGRPAAATLRFPTRRQPKTNEETYRLNLEIPPGLDWIRGTERGRVWLEALLALVANARRYGRCASAGRMTTHTSRSCYRRLARMEPGRC